MPLSCPRLNESELGHLKNSIKKEKFIVRKWSINPSLSEDR